MVHVKLFIVGHDIKQLQNSEISYDDDDYDDDDCLQQKVAMNMIKLSIMIMTTMMT